VNRLLVGAILSAPDQSDPDIHPAFRKMGTEIAGLVAGLLDSSQYSEGPATGHLGTGYSWFPCV
jgi:hypothetical protein